MKISNWVQRNWIRRLMNLRYCQMLSTCDCLVFDFVIISVLSAFHLKCTLRQSIVYIGSAVIFSAQNRCLCHWSDHRLIRPLAIRGKSFSSAVGKCIKREIIWIWSNDKLLVLQQSAAHGLAENRANAHFFLLGNRALRAHCTFE